MRPLGYVLVVRVENGPVSSEEKCRNGPVISVGLNTKVGPGSISVG